MESKSNYIEKCNEVNSTWHKKKILDKGCYQILCNLGNCIDINIWKDCRFTLFAISQGTFYKQLVYYILAIFGIYLNKCY